MVVDFRGIFDLAPRVYTKHGSRFDFSNKPDPNQIKILRSGSVTVFFRAKLLYESDLLFFITYHFS